MTKQEIRESQRVDAAIRSVLHCKERGVKQVGNERLERGQRLLLKEWRRLVVKDGILFREKAKKQQKKHYDRRARVRDFQPGDRHLDKVCHTETRQKLGDRWEPSPYLVVKKQSGTPVYIVHSEDDGRERVLHENLLTQCMFLPATNEETPHSSESGEGVTQEELSDVLSAAGDGGDQDEADSEGDEEQQFFRPVNTVNTSQSDAGDESLAEVEKDATPDSSGDNPATEAASGPLAVSQRRYPVRERRAPNKLSLELRAVDSKTAQEKI
ncbi:hypothetical protein MHYP_G00343770 [Metynnis hypsauchen]